MEQALPLRSDWLNFNRFRARAEHTVPLGPYRLLLCGKGAPESNLVFMSFRTFAPLVYQCLLLEEVADRTHGRRGLLQTESTLSQQETPQPAAPQSELADAELMLLTSLHMPKAAFTMCGLITEVTSSPPDGDQSWRYPGTLVVSDASLALPCMCRWHDCWGPAAVRSIPHRGNQQCEGLQRGRRRLSKNLCRYHSRVSLPTDQTRAGGGPIRHPLPNIGPVQTPPQPYSPLAPTLQLNCDQKTGLTLKTIEFSCQTDLPRKGYVATSVQYTDCVSLRTHVLQRGGGGGAASRSILRRVAVV